MSKGHVTLHLVYMYVCVCTCMSIYYSESEPSVTVTVWLLNTSRELVTTLGIKIIMWLNIDAYVKSL